jgi:hypothetical protein
MEDPIVDTELAEKTIDDVAEGAKHLVRRGFQRGTATGLVIGLSAGAVAGYFIAKRQLKAKYAKIADEEISEMRQHYFEKGKALESEAAKRPLGEIVKEQGYSPEEDEEEEESTAPPMVVRPAFPEPDIRRPLPPRSKAELDADELAEQAKEAEPKTRNVFQEAEVTHEWDWHKERRSRSPEAPYVIHKDEIDEMDYQVLTVTYYEGDNVICYDNDEILDPDKRDEILGEDNLDRFGHGSQDASIVYIRNDKLELVYEVVRSPNWYAEEVHGFSHTDYGRNLERMRVRERDEQEE